MTFPSEVARVDGRTMQRPPRLRSDPLSIQVDLRDVAERVAELVLQTLNELRTPSSPWLDLQSAAEYLGCSPERLRKLVQRRAVPFHQERPGGRIFFHRLELDEWMLAQ